jgi:hypothetical protein
MIISTLKEEHAFVAGLLADTQSPGLSSDERKNLLILLRGELSAHTKKEADLFYASVDMNDISTKERKILEGNFTTIHRQLMDTLDTAIEHYDDNKHELEFVSNILRASMVLEETVLFPFFAKNLADRVV